MSRASKLLEAQQIGQASGGELCTEPYASLLSEALDAAEERSQQGHMVAYRAIYNTLLGLCEAEGVAPPRSKLNNFCRHMREELPERAARLRLRRVSGQGQG